MASDPMAVVQAFNEATNGGDVDRIVAFFTDDAVLTTHPSTPPDPGIYTGKQEIRAWLDPQMKNFHVDSRNFQANGETVTWDATASGDMFRQMGIDTFDVQAVAKVRDDKISGFTITQTPETVEKFQKAMMQSGAG